MDLISSHFFQIMKMLVRAANEKLNLAERVYYRTTIWTSAYHNLASDPHRNRRIWCLWHS